MWMCLACTMNNDDVDDVCDVCSVPRGHESLPSSITSSTTSPSPTTAQTRTRTITTTTTTTVQQRPASTTSTMRNKQNVEAGDNTNNKTRDMQRKSDQYNKDSNTSSSSNNNNNHNNNSTSDSTTRLERESKKLLDKLTTIRRDKRYLKLLEKRRALPSFKMTKTILESVENHQAVVICGSTGCGKTTQVPQFILDSWIDNGKGGSCNIVCTQPRRISAIGVADRVASERVSPLGEDVGYQIRLENKASARTRLMFCTTGILLRKLESDTTLSNISHVIVDEVHERSIESDFLLMILRDLLIKRPDLTVIMMSATVNAKLFSDYFGGEDLCPVVTIPGKAFAVESWFLEDAIDKVRYNLDEGSKYEKKKGKKGAGKGGADLQVTPDVGLSLKELKERYRGYLPTTIDTLSRMDFSQLNLDLVLEVLLWICSPQQQKQCAGAVLVFLPGFANISQLLTAIEDSPAFDKSRLRIVPLHSTLSAEEQAVVFSRPPAGVIKVVLSTNIAETSVTIDDVVWVVDAGRMKETRFDPGTKMASLEETWVAQANALQRRGRAGRVKAGKCFHLVTKPHFDSLLPHQPPEIHRVPLEQVCLQIKSIPALELAAVPPPSTVTTTAISSITGKKKKASPYVGVMAVLARAIEPPRMKAVFSAVGSLKGIQAFDTNEKLTALGRHLAFLPVDCRIGKLLLFGAMFRCLDWAATIAACLSLNSPFVGSFDNREEADAIHKTFATGNSDYLTLAKVYGEWVEAGTARQQHLRRKFAKKNFLSHNTLQQAMDLKRQFVALLAEIGFAPPSLSVRSIEKLAFNREKETGVGTDGVLEAVGARANANANHQVLKAVLCAALYPNVIKPVKINGKSVLVMKGNVQVAFHPSSIVEAKDVSAGRQFYVYLAKVKTTKIYAKECSQVGVYPMLLFADALKLQGSTLSTINPDETTKEAGFISVQLTSSNLAKLVISCREALDSLLNDKIAKPALDISADPVIQTIIELINSER